MQSRGAFIGFIAVLMLLLGSCQASQNVMEKFLNMPNTTFIQEFSREYTKEPHLAGTMESFLVANYTYTKMLEFGFQAELLEFESLMSYPARREVKMLAPIQFDAGLNEPVVPGDPFSSNPNIVDSYISWGPTGSAQGSLVYVNYARVEDFEHLKSIGVSVEGKIAIARYGFLHRGTKGYIAEQNGAKAILIYSDPQDDGYAVGPTYPEGPWRPEYSIQRGSGKWGSICPGDPRRTEICLGKANLNYTGNLTPNIPIMPLSWGDALPFLSNMGGQEVIDDFRGALNITYRYGDEVNQASVVVEMNYEVKTLYNVRAKIVGSSEPDKVVLVGNHHDAWTFGAADPNSGSSAMLEVMRCFSELISEGWSPKRSIWFHSWDGEEHNLLGSTWYGEKYAAELQEKGVAYINMDVGAAGPNFSTGVSPSLIVLIEEMAGKVPYPGNEDNSTETILDHWDDLNDRQVLVLGSGSDFTVFIDHLGIPSIDFGFRAGGRGASYGVYHSAYDNTNWMEEFGDPGYLFHQGSARLLGSLIIRLSEDDHYPMDFTVYGGNLEVYYDTLEELIDSHNATEVDIVPILEAVTEFLETAINFKDEISEYLEFGWPDTTTRLEINQRMQDSERSFIIPRGLPERPWYRHIVQAPGLFLGYGAQVFPGVTQAILEGNWEVANDQVAVAAGVIKQASDMLKPPTQDNKANFILLYVVLGLAGIVVIAAIVVAICYCRKSKKQYEEVS